MKKEPSDYKTEKPDRITLYIEAREEGTLPQFYLELFHDLKHNYTDELPEEDVRNHIEIDQETGLWKGLNYKCRGNYIVGLSSWLQGAIEDSVITENLIQGEINSFRKHSFNFERGEFTSQKEINMMNKVLDIVIENLSEEQPL